MLTLTTEIKSRRFKEDERRFVYNYLVKPFREKADNIKKSFITFLEDNVLKEVLNSDLLELSKKKYCRHTLSFYSISSSSLGLGTHYHGDLDPKKYRTSLSFEFSSPKFTISLYPIIYKLDITEPIINKCSKEVKDQIKYFLYEYAKADYEYLYYGCETFIKKDIHSGVFVGVNTWGSLYKKDPKLFEILYNQYFEKEKDIKKEIVEENSEKKLLQELKFSLGY